MSTEWRPSKEWPSDHLRLDTWSPRNPDASGVGEIDDIRAAWDRARRLNMAHAPRGYARVPGHDEARYDAETQTVLFRRNDTLTTCYSVREDAITNDHGVAVRQAVKAQFGPIEAASTSHRDTEHE